MRSELVVNRHVAYAVRLRLGDWAVRRAAEQAFERPVCGDEPMLVDEPDHRNTEAGRLESGACIILPVSRRGCLRRIDTEPAVHIGGIGEGH
jgi:hypothetical protein